MLAETALLATREAPIDYTLWPDIPWGHLEDCTFKICPPQWGYVNYQPSLGGNALFAAIFGLLILPQLYLAIRHRTIGYGISILMGIALELIGYVARILMHGDPFRRDAFLIYLICLTIAPVFLTAGIYLCLGRIVIVYDPQERFSLIKARSYLLIFCACDIISLVLQAIGGGMAAEADDGSAELHTGTHIMVAGLSMQVASLLLFAYFCLDFSLRVKKQKGTLDQKHANLYHSRHFKLFLISLGLATLFIFIRSVFRVAELSEGFDSSLANNEVSFMILDGTMVVLACLLLTIFHPGISFKGTWTEANFHFRTRKGGAGAAMEEGVAVNKGRRGVFGRRGEKSPVVQESDS